MMNYQETTKKIYNIAVIVAGIDEEYQNSIIEGIIDCAKVYHANISCFASFSGVIASTRYDVGEYNIYELVNLEKFDAVILMTNTISNPEEKEKDYPAVPKNPDCLQWCSTAKKTRISIM